jgi:hypothetical protein
MFYRGKIMWFVLKYGVLWGVYCMLLFIPVALMDWLFGTEMLDYDITFIIVSILGVGLILLTWFAKWIRNDGGGIQQNPIIEKLQPESKKPTIQQSPSIEEHLALSKKTKAEPFTSHIFCTNCGRKASSTAKFCKGCGESLISQ